MAPPDVRRPFKRPTISDQQKRRERSLLRQAQSRLDAQNQARFLASTFLTLHTPNFESGQAAIEPELQHKLELGVESELEREKDEEMGWKCTELNIRHASRSKGAEVQKWFARQLMLPEWMIDVPDRLDQDWYVLARPAGKRCFVVSSNGQTISRLRNGSVLHHFPSALPNGARRRDVSDSAQFYCILDCIFHELDQTYYIIDMVCWRAYSLYDCTAEFRFFWLNSKLVETGACGPPSHYHKYRFSIVPIFNCDKSGLLMAYTGVVPYIKDGLLFYNKHAHYQTGNTPLALVWKDENCSQYVIDTDKDGQVLDHQQVILELQDDGKLASSDNPPVFFGCLDGDFIQKVGASPGTLLRFAIGDGGLSFVKGKLEKADLCYLSKVNRVRAFADSYSKVVFQYMVRHSPLKIDDLFASLSSSNLEERETSDVEMVG